MLNWWKLLQTRLVSFMQQFSSILQDGLTTFLQLDGAEPWGLRSNSPSHTVLVTNWQLSTGTSSQTFIVPWNYLIQVLKSRKIHIVLFMQTCLQFWTVFVSHSFFRIGLQTCRSTGEQTVLGTNFSTLEQILSELGLHFRSVTSLRTNWHSSTWVGSQDFLVIGLHVSLQKR